MEQNQEETNCVTCNIPHEGWARIAAKEKEARKWHSRHEKSYEFEDRCALAVIVLGTMTVVSALVCGLGPWIPERLLISAAITFCCSGLGVMCFMIISLTTALKRLDSM